MSIALHGRNEPVRRFWAKVDNAGSCWVWQASRTRHGYGRFKDGANVEVCAHRFAYELCVGPIPSGLQIDHLCRNRACVNPAHLEPVTHRENLLRGTGWSAVNAAKTHCPSGHEYSPENTYHPPTGGRQCRECKRLARSPRRQTERQAA